MKIFVNRRAVALTVSVAALVAAGLVWAFFVFSLSGQRFDAAAYGGAHWAQVGPWRLVDAARSSLFLPVAAVVVIGVVGWLWLHGLRRRAALVSVMALGSALSIQLLKHQVLVRPDLGFPPDSNSLPSGHTGAVAAAAVALLLATPRRRRAVVALAASWATAGAGVASVIGFQHRPSDIVAGILVVLAWAAAASAALPGDRALTAGDRALTARGTGRHAVGPTAGGGAVRAGGGRGASWALTAQGWLVTVPAVAGLAVVLAGGAERSISPLETLVALNAGAAAILATSSFAFAVLDVVAPDLPAPRRRAVPLGAATTGGAGMSREGEVRIGGRRG